MVQDHTICLVFEGFRDSLNMSWNSAPFCSSSSVFPCEVFEYLKVWWPLSFNTFLLIGWLWKSLTMKCLWRKWGTNPDCQYYVGFCELNVFLSTALKTALVTVWYLKGYVCQQHFFLMLHNSRPLYFFVFIFSWKAVEAHVNQIGSSVQERSCGTYTLL